MFHSSIRLFMRYLIYWLLLLFVLQNCESKAPSIPLVTWTAQHHTGNFPYGEPVRFTIEDPVYTGVDNYRTFGLTNPTPDTLLLDDLKTTHPQTTLKIRGEQWMLLPDSAIQVTYRVNLQQAGFFQDTFQWPTGAVEWTVEGEAQDPTPVDLHDAQPDTLRVYLGNPIPMRSAHPYVPDTTYQLPLEVVNTTSDTVEVTRLLGSGGSDVINQYAYTRHWVLAPGDRRLARYTYHIYRCKRGRDMRPIRAYCNRPSATTIVHLHGEMVGPTPCH